MPGEQVAKESRAGRTLRLILEAAYMEFKTRGFEHAKIESIATRAGVSKPLIYHYYGTKEELYADVMHELALNGEAMLAGVCENGANPIDQLEHYLHELFALLVANGENFSKDIMSGASSGCWAQKSAMASSRRMLVAFEHIIAHGKKMGEIKDDLDWRQYFFATFLMTSGFFSARDWMSAYLLQDYCSERATEAWRESAVSMLLRLALTDEAWSARAGGDRCRALNPCGLESNGVH